MPGRLVFLTTTDGGVTLTERLRIAQNGNITVGSSGTALGKLAVDGTANEIQLLVQGNATQTTDLVIFENSAGTDLFNVSGAGLVTIARVNDSASNNVMNITGNDRAVPANDDEGFLTLQLDSSNGATTEFARISWVATDVTAGSQDSAVDFDARVAGTLTHIMRVGSDGTNPVVAINTASPTASAGNFQILTPDNGIGQRILINVAQASVTAADVFINFSSTTGVEGSVAGTATAGLIAYNTFTGSHWSQSDLINKIRLSEKVEEVNKESGESFETEREIVSYSSDLAPNSVLVSVDELCSWPDDLTRHLPKCKVSDKAEDKAVYGVYGGHDNDGDIMVLAVGSGLVLVCDEGGLIEIGDFLCTSSVKGYAKKYNGNDMRVVLGKARQTFNRKKGEIACTYMCG